MPPQTDHRVSGELVDRLHDAHAVTAGLLRDVIRGLCSRFLSVGRAENSARIERLMKSGAWTDVALALIELELPMWQVRRIVYDAGEWHCALSRQRELPDWLDQSIEACHADLSLAILMAFTEVQRVSAPPVRTSVPNVPCLANAPCIPVCCDNFA
jgi:hypothetical protein